MGIEKINYDKCTSCRYCYDICPMDVFGLVGDTVYLAYPEDCSRCFLCDRICRPKAIEINANPVKPIPRVF